MKFSKFRISAPDLGVQKSHVKTIFLDTTAQPQPPAHFSRQADGLISNTIVRIQNRKRKRYEDARKFCSPNFCFEVPAENNLTWTDKQNRLYNSRVIRNDHGDAARH